MEVRDAGSSERDKKHSPPLLLLSSPPLTRATPACVTTDETPYLVSLELETRATRRPAACLKKLRGR
jgi:hypothetical protein